MTISIIIVHYQVSDLLLSCLRSLYKNHNKEDFEVIVVDNDEVATIDRKLKKEFPHATYVKNKQNTGYSGGNNLGACVAKGTFLFFLNPDTLVKKNTLAIMSDYLEKHKEAGIVAPLLLDKNETAYPLQGTKELTPLRAIFALSFLQKLFPKNPIANSYWNKDWNKKETKAVDVVPGSAFMIRRELFEKLKGFDERYFLFFEEHDICNRVKELGFTIVIVPSAQIIHLWGESTKKSTKNIQAIFEKSRFYYFKKFYGLLPAMLIESILRFSKMTVVLLGIVGIAAFLRFYLLDRYMVFIGDFAWFYLSAKDMLFTGQIPLVGIASSHPWIHQGAFWTYLLASALAFGAFDPLAGGYLAAGIGVLTVLVVYVCTKHMFDTKTALFTAGFFATSPLIVFASRMPYHTSPIPLFVALYLYSLYQWVKGKPRYFSFSLFFLMVLYNFELATIVLVSTLVVFLLYGFYKKTQWFKQIFSKNILILSFLAMIIPLTPMFLYDVSHGFPQTVKFGMWLGYRMLILFGYPPLHPEIPTGTYAHMLPFLEHALQQFYYLPNALFASGISLASIVVLAWLLWTKKQAVYFLLTLSLFVPLIIIFFGKTPSEAYLPMLFVQGAILVGMLFSFFITTLRSSKWLVYSLFVLLMSANIFTLLGANFFTSNAGTFLAKKEAVKKIISQAKNKEFVIQGKGPGSQFQSFAMPYTYITWWLGNSESKSAKQVFFIAEDTNGITIDKK